MQDVDVPVEVAHYFVEKMGYAGQGHILTGENHTLIRRHWRGILEEVIAAAAATTAGGSSDEASKKPVGGSSGEGSTPSRAGGGGHPFPKL